MRREGKKFSNNEFHIVARYRKLQAYLMSFVSMVYGTKWKVKRKKKFNECRRAEKSVE